MAHQKVEIINKKAKFNYELFEKHETGIVLSGGEVKAIRGGRVNMANAFVKIIDNEAYLVNASIPIEGKKDYTPTRSRKLLLHRNELTTIESTIKAKKLTIVPVKLYNKGRRIKLQVALAKSKNKVSKKEDKKRQDIEREAQRELRGDKDNDSRR